MNARDNILKTALNLFAEHGFSHVSINQIAQQAGVTKSLIFHHFDNKASLWDSVKSAIFEAFAHQQMQLFEDIKDPVELIEQSMRSYFSFIRDNRQIARIFSWAHLEGDPSCGEMDQPLIQRAVELIAQAQDAGGLRAGFDPVTLVITFTSCIEQYFMAQCHYDKWSQDLYTQHNLFLDNLIDIVIRGIKP